MKDGAVFGVGITVEVGPLSLRKEKLSVSSCNYFSETLRPRMFRRASSLVEKVLHGACTCRSLGGE